MPVGQVVVVVDTAHLGDDACSGIDNDTLLEDIVRTVYSANVYFAHRGVGEVEWAYRLVDTRKLSASRGQCSFVPLDRQSIDKFRGELEAAFTDVNTSGNGEGRAFSTIAALLAQVLMDYRWTQIDLSSPMSPIRSYPTRRGGISLNLSQHHPEKASGADPSESLKKMDRFVLLFAPIACDWVDSVVATAGDSEEVVAAPKMLKEKGRRATTPNPLLGSLSQQLSSNLCQRFRDLSLNLVWWHWLWHANCQEGSNCNCNCNSTPAVRSVQEAMEIRLGAILQSTTVLARAELPLAASLSLREPRLHLPSCRAVTTRLIPPESDTMDKEKEKERSRLCNHGQHVPHEVLFENELPIVCGPQAPEVLGTLSRTVLSLGRGLSMDERTDTDVDEELRQRLLRYQYAASICDMQTVEMEDTVHAVQHGSTQSPETTLTAAIETTGERELTVGGCVALIRRQWDEIVGGSKPTIYFADTLSTDLSVLWQQIRLAFPSQVAAEKFRQALIEASLWLSATSIKQWCTQQEAGSTTMLRMFELEVLLHLEYVWLVEKEEEDRVASIRTDILNDIFDMFMEMTFLYPVELDGFRLYILSDLFPRYVEKIPTVMLDILQEYDFQPPEGYETIVEDLDDHHMTSFTHPSSTASTQANAPIQPSSHGLAHQPRQLFQPSPRTRSKTRNGSDVHRIDVAQLNHFTIALGNFKRHMPLVKLESGDETQGKVTEIEKERAKTKAKAKTKSSAHEKKRKLDTNTMTSPQPTATASQVTRRRLFPMSATPQAETSRHPAPTDPVALEQLTQEELSQCVIPESPIKPRARYTTSLRGGEQRS
jgi:hypothetical protein